MTNAYFPYTLKAKNDEQFNQWLSLLSDSGHSEDSTYERVADKPLTLALSAEAINDLSTAANPEPDEDFEETSKSMRQLVALAGIDGVNHMMPVAEKLALILNGITSIEESSAESQNPETQKVFDEFILTAFSLPKTHLIGALFYAMPELARAQAKWEAKGD
jgi:hypothetical protein